MVGAGHSARGLRARSGCCLAGTSSRRARRSVWLFSSLWGGGSGADLHGSAQVLRSASGRGQLPRIPSPPQEGHRTQAFPPQQGQASWQAAPRRWAAAGVPPMQCGHRIFPAPPHWSQRAVLQTSSRPQPPQWPADLSTAQPQLAQVDRPSRHLTASGVAVPANTAGACAGGLRTRPAAERPRNRTPPATASEQKTISSFRAGISSHQRQTVEPTSGRPGSGGAGAFAAQSSDGRPFDSAAER
jgi:hypothetical protein